MLSLPYSLKLTFEYSTDLSIGVPFQVPPPAVPLRRPKRNSSIVEGDHSYSHIKRALCPLRDYALLSHPLRDYTLLSRMTSSSPPENAQSTTKENVIWFGDLWVEKASPLRQGFATVTARPFLRRGRRRRLRRLGGWRPVSRSTKSGKEIGVVLM
ncbi:hypothetical protein PIB30_045109 [Stylosanthes scabra]|uniref:Uncharacterized protein n=1 Tax=Stylosanthes scabra TaxID=79078 RepID=A0ABU6QHJ4_9FABA|nr:hypothetical protein [Stylosanthes scabra]